MCVWGARQRGAVLIVQQSSRMSWGELYQYARKTRKRQELYVQHAGAWVSVLDVRMSEGRLP